jgi:peptidoglycan/LPS O-acetylase OafA/YrhL
MSTTTLSRATTRPSLEQLLVGFVGTVHLLTGVATLLTPAWFFQNIGTFAPYNRHYEGDLGAFQLGLGVALLLAARRPERQRLLIGATALGNLVHALNHTYDALIIHAPLSYWLRDTAPLYLFAVAIALLATGWLGRAER